jgi:hypothetical protein
LLNNVVVMMSSFACVHGNWQDGSCITPAGGDFLPADHAVDLGRGPPNAARVIEPDVPNPVPAVRQSRLPRDGASGGLVRVGPVLQRKAVTIRFDFVKSVKLTDTLSTRSHTTPPATGQARWAREPRATRPASARTTA